MTIDGVNERAQEKFQQLRSKLKLDLQKPIMESALQTYNEKMKEMMEQPIPSDIRSAPSFAEANVVMNEAGNAVRFVDDAFEYINKLELPSNLSLAIGLLISAHKTKNVQDLYKSIDAIGDAIKEIQI